MERKTGNKYMNAVEYKSKLLQKDALVKMDVFVHDPTVLASVREALAAGLTPGTFSLIGDSVVLRLEGKE